MSWKESKVHLVVPRGHPNEDDEDDESSGRTELVLPIRSRMPRSDVDGRKSIDSGKEYLMSSSKIDSSERIMPPPPPPPPSVQQQQSPVINRVPSSTSGVSSTSNDHHEESNIEFDGNDQVLCRVCGDKASGFHYGVHSCEGCKGFFRRSIQQKIQYRPCTKNQQCNILRINRNRCQYCRLKKCIAAGMSRDAVRFGRVPKREKAKILAAMQSSRMKTQEAKVLTEMSDDSKIIEEIVRAHYDNCDYTRNKMEPFLARAKDNPYYVPCTGMTCPMKGRPEDSFLDQFSERFMDHVRQVCTFAKRIPGFECLHKDDKVMLLKSCVFEVLLVRLSGLFDNQSLVCLNGDIIRKDTINQMPAGNAKFLMDSIFELAQRLNQFNLSDAEIGIFCAVVIITPDRPGLRNPDLVQKMQNKLKNVLNNILIPQHSDQPGIFSELLSMVHDLRTLNTLHTEKFLQQCKIGGRSEGSGNGGNIQQSILYGHHQSHHRDWIAPNTNLDRESVGSGSPHSSSDAHSEQDRRSPIGSVSSSESGCSAEVSRLTVQDLKVNNSVLLNALSAAGGGRKRLKSDPEPEYHRPPSAPNNESNRSAGNNNNITSSAGVKCPFKARKLDSPSDSGIDSPKNHGTSICSSPRSSVEEEKHPPPNKEEEDEENQETSDPPASVREEQHPLLKRALQKPPQSYSNGHPSTNNLVSNFQEEVYKPHKKFRRYNLLGSSSSSEECYPTSSSGPRRSEESSSILATTLLSSPPQTAEPPKAHYTSRLETSLLASTLSKAAPMASDQCKRNEMLASLILDRQYFPPPSSSPQGLLMCAPTRSPPSSTTTSAQQTYTSSTSEKTPTSEPQPLNLSTRTPPPPHHDIPTEA